MSFIVLAIAILRAVLEVLEGWVRDEDDVFFPAPENTLPLHSGDLRALPARANSGGSVQSFGPSLVGSLSHTSTDHLTQASTVLSHDGPEGPHVESASWGGVEYKITVTGTPNEPTFTVVLPCDHVIRKSRKTDAAKGAYLHASTCGQVVPRPVPSSPSTSFGTNRWT